MGEIASRPQWSKTTTGSTRWFARIKITARRRHPDGTYGDPETSFHNLVAFGHAAERGRTRLREGDVIVAAGYVRANLAGTGEEFVMRWWGHETWRTPYAVTRTTPVPAPRGRLPFRARTPRPASPATASNPAPSTPIRGR
ncbi:hypothetical protein [Isoptericola sp. NPDC019482]|uniref:single-stranded DNA-binding protein n=1 Tax=Isoptericola sp. NPDC019482 TaxID=3154688 RepID=UPI003473AC0C